MNVTSSNILQLLRSITKAPTFNYPNFLTLWNLSTKFHNNKSFVLKFLQANENIFHHIPLNFKEDKAFVIKLLKENINVYHFLNPQLRSDIDILNICIKKNLCSLEFLNNNLKNNPAIVKKFISLDANNFHYASKSLKKDKSIINLALKTQPESLIYLDDSYKNNNKLKQKLAPTIDIYDLNSCLKHPKAFPFFEKSIQENPVIIKNTFLAINTLTLTTTDCDSMLISLQDSFIESDGLFDFFDVIIKNINPLSLDHLLIFHLSHEKLVRNKEFAQYLKQLGLLRKRKSIRYLSYNNLLKVLEIKKQFDFKKSLEQEIKKTNKTSSKLKY